MPHVRSYDRERSIWRLSVDPTFGPYIVGKLASTAGVWIHNIASAILVFQLTSSAIAVGFISVAQFTPQLLLAPFSGIAADRGSRRSQLLVGRLLAGMASGGLAVWIATVGIDGATGALIVTITAAVCGIGYAIGAPAMQALIPDLVRPNEVLTAVALNNVPLTLGRALGPALGAILLATLGPAATFGVAAAGNLVFAAVLGKLQIAESKAEGEERASFRRLYRFLRESRSLPILLLSVGMIGIAVDPVVTLTPSIAAFLQGGDTLVGILASSFGAGAGTTFVLLGAIRRLVPTHWMSPLALVGLGSSMGALSLSQNPQMALAALFLGGMSMTLGLTSLTTDIHTSSPNSLRGSIMGVWSVAFVGSRPIAASLNGLIADSLSWQAATAVTATLAMATGGVLARRAARPHNYHNGE